MRRKYHLLLLFLTFSGSTLQAQTQVVPQSGVNWRESVLTLNRFQPANPSHRESFLCFDKTYEELPIQMSLFDLGYDNSDSGPLTLNQALETQSCFQKAGWYDLSIKIEDFAGNTSQFDQVLTIEPAELSLADSTLDPMASSTSGGQTANFDIVKRANCTSLSLVADGQDACVLEVNLRDRFGNVIRPDALTGDITLNLPSDQASARLDASRDLYGAFLAGLFFEGETKTVSFALPTEPENLRIGLKAYVPSLALENEDNDLLKAVVPAPQNVNIEFVYNPEEADLPTINTNKTIKPLFSPWVQIWADATDGAAANLALLPLNRVVQIPFLITGAVEKEIPRKLSVDWQSPDLDSLNFRFEASNDDPKTLRDLVSIEEPPQPYTLETSLIQLEGRVTDEAFVLQPIITYLLQINEENRLVRYPLSIFQDRALNRLPAFKPSLVQMVIEDIDNNPIESEEATNVILADRDKILYSDWRRRASRNVISLVRGIPPLTSAEFDINNGFGERDIAYFRGVDLRLTGVGETDDPLIFDGGAKTIIVEDGNLVLDRDLLYKSVSDSLGFIVINTRSGDPDRGNVFVGPSVKKVVGSYFVDSSFMSLADLDNISIYQAIEDRETTPNQNLSAPLANQLVLEGALITRNTIGGADSGNPSGPNGETITRDLALNYDLNYIRRYEPLFDLDGFRVADAQNIFCYQPIEGNCYPNPAPFVIQDDERLQSVPPPGFELEE